MNTEFGQCLICLRKVPDYIAEFCCGGHECACMGQPIEPCICSKACDDALMDGKGGTMEDRRNRHNIPLAEEVRLRNSHDALVEALKRIATPFECGCWPCTGQCRTPEMLDIDLSGLREIAGEPLKLAEGKE